MLAKDRTGMATACHLHHHHHWCRHRSRDVRQDHSFSSVYGWMHCMHACMHACMHDGWMDGGMDGRREGGREGGREGEGVKV